MNAVHSGGFLLPLALMVPAIGALVAVACGGRHAHRVALATVPLGLGIALLLVI